ncbi:ANTAR domain-containing protein [Nocardioides guangzhouensis]|uniref:histidine kinase n=1 Tax=Nocardioides guangzhouensis TaxID=2497878 RepID=A0A4Q4Z9Y1_9ACTN|nr:PAS and ANTAR domain-containing protein [Nocardioides guangzhouensis]RYP83996.1 ANTAR domain-containing protein [Nocardioides guangzhouensis]
MATQTADDDRRDDGLDQHRTGSFRYDVPSETWHWSPGIFHIYGFEPGDVVPTTDLMRRHVHPEDTDLAFSIGDRALRSGESFSSHFRIVDNEQRVREVIAVGHSVLGDEGGVTALEGHVVDITDAEATLVQEQVTLAVDDFRDHRAVIEQAKGVLVQLFSIDPDTAFLALARMSQARNVKVRYLAEELVEAAGRDATPTKGAGSEITDVLARLT